MRKAYVLLGAKNGRWHELDRTLALPDEPAESASNFLRSIAWTWADDGFEHLTVVRSAKVREITRTKPWLQTESEIEAALEEQIRAQGWFLNRCEDGTFQVKEWHGDPDESGPFQSIQEARDYALENPNNSQSQAI